MSFKTGFAGIPVSLRCFKRKPNPEILKQWQDLDKKKREKREEKRLREIRRTQRVESRKAKRKKASSASKGRK